MGCARGVSHRPEAGFRGLIFRFPSSQRRQAILGADWPIRRGRASVS